MLNFYAYFAALLGSAAADQPANLPADVQAVIDRSHQSRADYSVFLSFEITMGGRTHREVQAEFQAGRRHRVEVAVANVVADCETGDQVTYNIPLGTIEAGRDTGACGISMASDIIVSGRMLPPITGSYGRADVIELTGKKFVRRYAVTPDGIIVSNNYQPISSDVDFTIRTLSSQVVRGAPDPSMFKQESIKRRFAPTTEANSVRRVSETPRA